MNTGEFIGHARTLPAGAVFHRCALQVNPHHYRGTFRGAEIEGDTDTHARSVVEKAVELGVTVLAVTDHNSVRDVPAFRHAARGTNVVIFPGFELSSTEGIHVLCIHPRDTTDERLQRFLGEFGIRKTDPSSDPSNSSFVDILSMTRSQGGLAIAAHVTNSGGLLKVLSGQPRIQAWRNDDLLAIQIPGSVNDLDHDINRIVKNKSADYRRAHAAGDALAVAAINAKDVTSSEDLEDPSATCWIKMSEVTIEGLRQAFLDPDSRIRLNSDSPQEEHVELVALSWEGGFLDGVTVRFNPNLNVLIGGRGAGKSTVIETLRYVLGLSPVGDEALKAHQGIVGRVLRSGTKLSLLVRTRHPVLKEYRIDRTIPNPPVVRDESGRVSSLRPREILPHVEVYGQHEISELTRSGEKLTRLLDRFTERDASLERQKIGLRQDLEKTRRAILDGWKDLQQIDERLGALPGLEETLQRYQAAGLEDRLGEQSLLVREERVLGSIPDRLRPFREGLDLLREELPIDRAFLSPKALADLPGKEILEDADGVLDRLNADIGEVVRLLDEALQRTDQGIAAIRSRWNRRRDEVDAAYQKILRELRKSAVDGEEFIRLRREIEGLRPLRERRSLLLRLADEHMTHRRALLAEWQDVKAREFRLLSKAARKVSRKLRDRVQVQVTAQGNREPLFELLRSGIGGRLKAVIEKLSALETLSLEELVDTCRAGVDSLQEKYGITAAQARHLAEAEPEVLMCIEELDLPPVTAIHLNTAPAGEPPSWQKLDHLSTGQKATAVLLLLLLDSKAPLIVDQPEDDLDNRFITEGVIPRMREEKRRRQFVFSTHNANIPVLGDAELILGLTASGEADEGEARIAPGHAGSIDTGPVRELIEEILEGGKDAFERRRRKYGF